jgi:glycosyltransferase involved in cell wall biosynthesis
VSHQFDSEAADPQRVAALLGTGDTRPPRYLLMVSTLEPRKNHLVLIDAWTRLRAQGETDLHLVVVGSPGWRFGAILQRMQAGIRDGGLHHLQGVAGADLRLLYRHAEVTVNPSLAEGFDSPGVEAMRSGGIVAASDLAVHREVYADAAAYFDPRSPDAAAACLRGLLGPDAAAERDRLRAAGVRVSARYLASALMPQWDHWLRRVLACR